MSARRRKSRSAPVNPLSRPRLRENVAGVDLGRKEKFVYVPVRSDREPNVEVFRSTTVGLQEMVEWLRSQGVESVAMESTHVYWIPLYELLESAGIEPILVNARQLHNVPGRKTDMADCQWLQLLHSCGLLRGSFRPKEAICRLRALRRQMANLATEQKRSIQWMQKSLDQMNVLVHRAVSDLTGHTGMAIVRAIVAGERDPARLAALRDKRCRKSESTIAEYLTGSWREEHLFNLKAALRLYDCLSEMIDSYQARLMEEMTALQPPDRRAQTVGPHPTPNKEKMIRRRGEESNRCQLWRFAGVDLTRIDGISCTVAEIVLTEIGLELSAFPTEKHFVSWLRLSPRVPYSAGKALKKNRNGFGATRVANALRMAALSLRKSKSASGAYYRRIARRKDARVAVFATARKLAVIIYRMLRYGQHYVDIGEDHYEERFRQQRINGLKAAARTLGLQLVEAPSPT